MTDNEKKANKIAISLFLAIIMPVGFGFIWGWKFGLGFFLISQFLLMVLQAAANHENNT